MQFEEMVRNVKARVKPITNSDIIIKRLLNEAQQDLFEKKKKGRWNFLKRNNYELSTTNATSEYALDPYFHAMISIRNVNDNRRLRDISEFRLKTIDPDLSSINNPYCYAVQGYTPVRSQPSAASVITFVSDNAGDDAAGTNTKIYVEGLSANNVNVSEIITLDGVNPVSTNKSYVKLLNLGKTSYTNGIVTATSNAGAVTNVIWGPNNRKIEHPLIFIYPLPTTETYIYDFYAKPIDLVNDYDFSIFPSRYHHVLERYAIYNLALIDKDSSNASSFKSLYDEGIKQMLKNDAPEHEVRSLSYKNKMIDRYYDEDFYIAGQWSR